MHLATRILAACLCVVPGLSGLASCGSGTSTGKGAVLDDRRGGTGNRDAASGSDGAQVRRDAAAPEGAADAGGISYHGVVLATFTQAAPATAPDAGPAPDPYTAFAVFRKGPAFSIEACWNETSSAGPCCCTPGILWLPLTLGPPPDVATVVLTTQIGGRPLATLTHSIPIIGDGSVSFTLQGTWDLGFWSLGPVSTYPVVDSGPWSAGEVLQVVAGGDEVHRFSGALRTGPLLTGVTPLIGQVPLVLNRARDFVVTWKPEAGALPDAAAGPNVLLMIRQIRSDGGLTCYCSVPDGIGQVAVSTTLLGQFGTDQLEATVRLERLTISNASADNATISLIGEVARSSDVTFR